HERDDCGYEQWKETKGFGSDADAHENNPFEPSHAVCRAISAFGVPAAESQELTIGLLDRASDVPPHSR
ncbi:MAG TPA: hypothetical protein VIL63_09555, partial [Terriglobales bacterium]